MRAFSFQLHRSLSLQSGFKTDKNGQSRRMKARPRTRVSVKGEVL